MRAAVAAIPLLVAVFTDASARTWNIHPDGSGDAATIQAAADAAAPGDSILVHPGTYAEQVTIDVDQVCLIGVGGSAATTVDAAGVGCCVTTQGSETLLKGLRFAGAGHSYGYGGWGVLAQTPTTIEECRFEPGGDAGAVLARGTTLSITGSELSGGASVLFGGSDLLIRDCTFRDNNGSWANDATVVQLWWESHHDGHTNAEIADNVFEDNLNSVSEIPVIGWDSTYGSGPLDLVVERNVFLRNGGPAVGPNDLAIICPRSGGGPVALTVRNNTIARHPGYSLGSAWPLPPGTVIDANAITGNRVGLMLPDGGAGFTVTCNDSWGNSGVDWVGFLDPTGDERGNVSAAPFYCSPSTGDFRPGCNSPLVPHNSACGRPIGALPQGCGIVSVEPSSWGRIKLRYR